MWSQICDEMAYVFTKLLKTKSAKIKKYIYIYKKKHESVHDLWKILGTKLVLQNSFPLFSLLFSTLNSRMSRNMCKLCHKVCNNQILPHESPNF